MWLRFLFIASIFFTNVMFSQDWDYDITDANMTIQISADVLSFDGVQPPIGSLLGAFYINDSGELACAGYQEWSGTQLAIALWASEAGADNGFQVSEEINWLIQVEGETYTPSVSEMNADAPISLTFIPNGFGQVLDLDFFSSGCSDVSACNYCSSCLEFDDTLCEYPDTGYDCDGNCINDLDFDGICDEFEIPGCMDIEATNYSEVATDDDGSCEYILYGCTNDMASNFNIDATDDDGSCLFCGDVNADNYYSGDGGTFCSVDILNNYTLEIGADGLLDCCFYANPGCTDDGSCFDADGDGDLDECADSFLYIDQKTGESVYYQSPFPGVPAANYNPAANILVGVSYCHYFPACQDPNAMNYGYNCNGDDILSLAESYGFSVDYNEEPESSPFSIVFNGFDIVFEESSNCCLYYGCDDENADNFHDLDGVFYQNTPESENYFGNGNINFPAMFNLNGTYEVFDPDLPDWANVVSSLSSNDIDGDGILNNIDSDPDNDSGNMVFQYTNQEDEDEFSPCIYLGCKDDTAINYDPSANIDDGTCQYYACEDPNSMNYQSAEFILENSNYLSCSDIDFYDNQTYIPVPDGLNDCCQYLGCLDPTAFNYNPSATIQELVFTAVNVGNTLIFEPIPILSELGDTIGYEDTCFPFIYGCQDDGFQSWSPSPGNSAENYNDYDGDGESDPFVSDTGAVIYQLTDSYINENGAGLFGISQLDIIEEFALEYGGLLGAHTNVNATPPNVDPNSVQPCEYIYGCTDPCYIEYYNVVEYSFEEVFNFSSINNILNNNGCDFYYDYGCTELIPPSLGDAPTFDDGSCSNILVYGCMDPMAANYNPNATINDCLSCIPSISVDFEVVNPLCYDQLEGVLLFSVSGGTGPYTYSLFNDLGIAVNQGVVDDENVALEIDLLIGDYFLEVSDSESYPGVISFSIFESSDFVIDLWESGGWLNTLEGYDIYEWTLNGELLEGEDFETYQIYPLESGLYGVTAYFDYDSDLCVSNTMSYNYDMFQTINENNDFSVSCVPNPLTNQAVVYVNKSGVFKLYIDLYDSFGKKVWNKTKIINEEKSFIINELPVGIYYFRVTTFNEVQTIPIIVLK